MVVEAGWGEAAVVRATARGHRIVIVDVLSFSTAVDVACGRGCRVLPVAPRDADSARSRYPGALMAASRRSGGPSLSPSSLAGLAPGTLLILPSPNGAALSALARGGPVLTACFRNLDAVTAFLGQSDRPVTLVAAGEKDDQGGWREADEDRWAVGGLAAGLAAVGQLSPEARSFADQFRRLEYPLPEALARTPSGKELLARRFGVDLDWASALNVSQTVPVLTGGVYGVPGAAS